MRALFRFLTAAIVLAAGLSGCFAEPVTEAPVVPTPPQLGLPEGFVDPMIMGHDHSDPALHELAFHMKETAHDPLYGNAARSSGAHAADIRAGWLFVATYGMQVDALGGVYIFNLSNPESPRFVGMFNLPGNLGGDRSMEATDDANYIVLGTEPFDCAGHAAITPGGLYLVDARDKSRPVFVDYVPNGFGTHSVVVHRVKGEDYAFTLGGNPNIYRIDRAAGKLVGVGQVQIRHDAAAYDDPVLGLPLLYVANQDDFVVYDISDPASPSELGRWETKDTKSGKHYVHAAAVDWIEGRRIVVIESEDWQTHVSPVWILDATDFSNITLLGTWTNPGKKSANAGMGSDVGVGGFNGQLIFSTHNPRVENGTIYLAHYHGGVWMLDISDLNKTADPQVLGYYLPHDNNGGFQPRSGEGAYPKPNLLCGFNLNQIPLVFDLEVQNGIVYALDMHTGLYVLKRDDTVLPGGHHHH